MAASMLENNTDATSELMEYLQGLFPGRADTLFEACRLEEINDVSTLVILDTNSLKQIGFKLGDVAKIKNDKDTKVRALMQQMQSKRQGMCSQKKDTKGKPKQKPLKVQKPMKIYLGWMHKEWENKKAKQIRDEDTGGVRCLDVSCSDELTVEYIISRAVKVFFPSGSSHKGAVADCTFRLSFYTEPFEQFFDTDGNACNFDQYLASRGKYPSRCILYLVSTGKKKKQLSGQKLVQQSRKRQDSGVSDISEASEASETHEASEIGQPSKRQAFGNEQRKSLVVWKGGKQGEIVDIDIKYQWQKKSLYGKKKYSTMYCLTKGQCLQALTLSDPEIQENGLENFHPIENGFTINSIKKGAYIYDANDKDPLKLCYGYEEDTLVLACLSHDKVVTKGMYTWYRNGIRCQSGKNLKILYVYSDGYYFCELAADDRSTYVTQPYCVEMRQGISEGRHRPENSEEHITMEVSNDVVEEANRTTTRKKENDDERPFKGIGSNANVHQQVRVREEVDKPSVCSIDEHLVSLSEIKYSDEDVINKGAFATVYKGQYKGTTVALKKLKARLITAKKYVRQEVAIHKEVSHPNIIMFLGAAMGKGYLLLIMEYMEGPNVEDLLFYDEISKNYQELTTVNKLSISRQIAQAIAYLHCRSPAIIHCDIKPANIVVSKNYDIAKLIDLGISKIKKMEQTLTTARKNVLPGTPSYLAPEVFLQNQKTSFASDIWSFGCTLAELFTEQECWSHYEDCHAANDGDDSDGEDDSIDTLKDHMSQQLPPHSSLADVCREMALVITQCVLYDSHKRPNALELAERVNGIQI